MTDELENADGVSRRSMLKKSALVGGTMVWAAPVVQSITSPAFGQAEPTPEENGVSAISFIALLLQCGDLFYRVKFEDDKNFVLDPADPACGSSFSVSACNEQLDSEDVEETCPVGVAAVENLDGSVTVTLGDCTIVDYVVKCGSGAYQATPDHTGCQDFPEEHMPLPGDSVSVIFLPCNTEGPTGS